MLCMLDRVRHAITCLIYQLKNQLKKQSLCMRIEPRPSEVPPRETLAIIVFSKFCWDGCDGLYKVQKWKKKARRRGRSDQVY